MRSAGKRIMHASKVRCSSSVQSRLTPQPAVLFRRGGPACICIFSLPENSSLEQSSNEQRLNQVDLLFSVALSLSFLGAGRPGSKRKQNFIYSRSHLLLPSRR